MLRLRGGGVSQDGVIDLTSSIGGESDDISLNDSCKMPINLDTTHSNIKPENISGTEQNPSEPRLPIVLMDIDNDSSNVMGIDNNDDGCDGVGHADPMSQEALELAYHLIANARYNFLAEVEALHHLPGNPLDTLIHELGGVDSVAELTGRKGRLIKHNGKFRFASRAENGVTIDKQNVFEKSQFMDGNKLVAIISDAASSGISLQADRRVWN